MNQKNKKSAFTDAKVLFETKFPMIKELASRSGSPATFKRQLTEAIAKDCHIVNEKAKENLLRLIGYDGRTIPELSEECEIRLETITLLWQMLRGEETGTGVCNDFLTDLCHQFERLYSDTDAKPSTQKVQKWMQRWPNGLDPGVITIRQRNKERIMRCLITKIERRHSTRSRYVFPDGISLSEKWDMVEQWWNDYHFQLAMAIRSPHELNIFLGETLSAEVMERYHQAVHKGIPVFVTPYYLSLLNIGDEGYDDQCIRSYVMYSQELVDTFGHIKAWEREDIIRDGEPNAAGWLLPDGRNIHRRYPDVAILIPDTVGRACGGLCASCQRMYNFQSGHLNFNLDELKPKETWQQKLQRLMCYFEEDKQLRDILITGGDALMSQDASLHHILDAVCKMALRKRRANEQRNDGKKYAELQRVRLGTRLPVYLPMRITDRLIGILTEFRQKAQEAGISQLYIQTHFQSPLEVTPEARDAIRKLQSAGWIITNQLVYNVAASRRGHTAALRHILNALDIVCYYTFTVKGFQENHAVFAPNSRSLQEQQEEKSVGQMDLVSEQELVDALRTADNSRGVVSTFCRRHHVPFIASDRNVLNLPGIGKSMSFRLVGIMEDGRRILEFDHDRTRRHSPVIEKYPHVYIRENKSIGEYLRQLSAIGEDSAQYESIWQYTEGETERRFPLYDYPEFPFRVTPTYNHLGDG